MAAEEKWYFTREILANTPSRKSGYDADKELSCRQQAANFIQDMGQRLQVTQLCINTAIVYMHRFYMFHSFTRFHRNAIAAAALFLAAKVEEQPRKLEHVIKVAQICLHREQPPPDVKSDVYLEQAQELVMNENILLQTLGFDVAIDHPHTHVVRCCHLVKASKDLAQTSYFMASNSLHLTTMCLQYKPTVVACFCIHLACKWSNWEIPQSTEGKPWFWYVDKSVTQELLEQLTEEFLAIFDKCPSRLKKKIMSLSSNQNPTILSAFSNEGDKKRNGDGSSSSNLTAIPASGPNISSGTSEEMKKKQEYLRLHPEFKKHHVPHHTSRSESHNIAKSSCMYSASTRSLPQAHSNSSNASNNTSSSSNTVLRPVPPSNKPTAVDPGALLGKQDHLHHRPRRPDDKHPRNHELVSSQYKKYDKVSSGVINNDFNTTNISSNNNNNNNCNNRVTVSNNNSSGYLNVPLNHIQSGSSVYLQQQSQQLQQLQPAISSQNVVPIAHQQTQNIEVVNRMTTIDSNSSHHQHTSTSSSTSINKHQLLVQQSSIPTVVTLSQNSVTNTKVKSPVVIPQTSSKVERSIFSPEKSTPPSEDIKLIQTTPPILATMAQQPICNTTTVTTTSSTPIITSNTAVRRKGETTVAESSNVLSHSKVDEMHNKTSNLNQYSNKTESVLKEEKIPDKQQEIAVSHNAETLVGQAFGVVPVNTAVVNTADELHTKEQKKKKKKHKEHKDRHRDKHKHKHKNRDPEPIVITIPKEKLTLPQQTTEQQGLLKIKIAKDKIAPSISSSTTAQTTGLKIKIPKDKIKESRKRDRSEDRTPGLPPGKLHRPNGTVQVNKVIDISECSDSENERNSISLETTNSPTPIALNDACPSFDELLRPGTPPGMSDVLLELFQNDISNNTINNDNKKLLSPLRTTPVASSASNPQIIVDNKQLINNPHKDLPLNETVQKPINYTLNRTQNGNNYNRTRYPGNSGVGSGGGVGSSLGGGGSGGGNSRRRGGTNNNRFNHLKTRLPPIQGCNIQPPQTAYNIGNKNNWNDVMRRLPPPVRLPPTSLPPGYLIGPPTAIHHHPQHYYAPMIVPNFPPPPPLPDDPPPQQPPPPPPE